MNELCVIEAVKTEGKTLPEIKGEVVELDTELVVAEEDLDSEVELVMEGRLDEDYLKKKKQAPSETSTKVEVVDTESEGENDAVEVTGDLDYDFVESDEETEDATSGLETSPASEVEINVELEKVEVKEHGEGKDETFGGLVGPEQEEDEVILLPEESPDHNEKTG